METNIKYKPNFSFWKHPIKWMRVRKQCKLMELVANNWYDNGGKEKIEKVTRDILMYGRAEVK